jgi:uncharacterized protein (TIGR00251 family)
VIREQDGGATLRVKVKPRASRDAIAGPKDGALVVRLTAAPVEGAANASLQKLLARVVRVPPSSIEILRGATGRDKLLRFASVSAAELRRRLESRRA